jgi:hypothetical protein
MTGRKIFTLAMALKKNGTAVVWGVRACGDGIQGFLVRTRQIEPCVGFIGQRLQDELSITKFKEL